MLFSPDGRLLEISHSERIVEVWDVLGGTRLHRRKHQGVINDVNFSDDSQKLIVGTSDTTARIFDARTGVPLGPPLRAGSFVRSVALAPDGRRAATRNRYGKIQLWDATTGEETGRWQLDEGDLVSVNSMWFSRDGRRLIVDVNGGKAFELSPCTIPPDVLPPLLELFTGRRIDPATDGIEFLPVGTFKQSPDAYTNAWRTWRDAVARRRG